MNFLSHFYVTNFIIRQQLTSFGSKQGEGHRSRSLRVINVASAAYSRGNMEHLLEMISRDGRLDADWLFDIYQSYADSKLAMMMFTTELNFRHYVNNDVLCLAAHPGNKTVSLLS